MKTISWYQSQIIENSQIYLQKVTSRYFRFFFCFNLKLGTIIVEMIVRLFLIVLSLVCFSESALAKISATALPLELVGTIIRKDSVGSIASVKWITEKQGDAYRVSQALKKQAKIVAIKRDRIYLYNFKTGRTEFLSLGAYDPKLAVSKLKMDQGHRNFQISRKYIDSMMKNLTTMLQAAGSEPVFNHQGQIVGFRITFIKKGSAWEKLGVRVGDVLKKVNGYELNSVEKVLILYNQLKDSSLIQIDMNRDKKDIRYEYRVR